MQTESPANIRSHYAGLWAGRRWLAGGYALFSKARARWIGLTLCFFLLLAVLSALASLVPVIGVYAASLLAPVFSAGVMLGCRDLDEGRALRVGRLTGGFTEGRTTQLLLVGLVWIAGCWLIGWVFAQVAGLWLAAWLGSLDLQALLHSGFSAETLTAVVPGFMIGLAVALILFLPLGMAVWFAPQLVQLGGINAGRAVALGFMACLRNLLPFAIYALLMLLTLFAIGLLVFGLVALLAKISPSLAMAGVVLYLLALLALAAVSWASCYVGYTDIFRSAASGAPVVPSAVPAALGPGRRFARAGAITVLVLALPVMCVGRMSLQNRTGQAFFDAVAAQDFAAAEEHVSPELMEVISKDGQSLQSALAWMGITDVESAKWSGASFGGDDDEDLTMEVVTRSGESVRVELGFGLDGGGWKIDAIYRGDFSPATPQPMPVAFAEPVPDTAAAVPEQSEADPQLSAPEAGAPVDEALKRDLENHLLARMGLNNIPSPRIAGAPEFSEEDSARMMYLGCFRDEGTRDLSGYEINGDGMTQGYCAQTCVERGHAYAAVQYGSYCFCGDSYARYGAATNCDMPCVGNAQEICGGGWANSVFRVRSVRPAA